VKIYATITIASIIIALGASFVIFSVYGDLSIAGFAIHNDFPEVEENEIEESLSPSVTEQDVLNAMAESEKIIVEMKENGFSTIFMEDTLLEAERVLEIARNSEILRDDSSSKDEKTKARKALELIEWKEITFADVLEYTAKIEERRNRAFFLYDSLIVAELSIAKEIEWGVLTSPPSELQEARLAFEEERYDEVEPLLVKFRDEVERMKAEQTTLATLKKGAQNFFQRYWIYILVFICILGIAGYFTYGKINKALLRKKIEKMNHEKKALTGLMRKAQIDRFKTNKIPALVYNIRMKKYKERMNEIKEKLPVFEKRLDILKRMRKF
jgi:hypothetical protein